jgi:hypothetical protein
MMDNNSASFDLSAPAMKMLSSQKAMPITKTDAEAAKLKRELKRQENDEPTTLDQLENDLELELGYNV